MMRGPIINLCHDTQEMHGNLIKNVNKIMDVKKGVIGLDDTFLAFNFCFSLVDQANDWENRRLFRQFVTTAPLQEQFSAALISEELMKQSDDEAVEFIDTLKGKGLLLGVRLDTGMSSIFGSNGEYIGTGMDDMIQRIKNYKQRSCLYSKWRSIYQIKENTPTLNGTETISNRLAQFAAMSQASGLVPIVSVEILPDGSEDIYKARSVLEKLLINLIKALKDFDVLLEATILQVSFVQPGRNSTFSISPEKIAEQTLEAFKRSLPVALGGLMFHSSGLSEENATQTLNHIILKKEANESMLPWRMTHSFGRAQKASAIVTWRGEPEFEEIGHHEIIIRAKANNDALLGAYVPNSVLGTISQRDLFIPNYVD